MRSAPSKKNKTTRPKVLARSYKKTPTGVKSPEVSKGPENLRVGRSLPTLQAAVIGGGTFGTALATLLAKNHRRVKIWVRRKEQANEINKTHINRLYFPDHELPHRLAATTDISEIIRGTPVVIMAVPSKHFRGVTREVGNFLTGDQMLVHATKGIEPGSHKRMSEILREETCALKVGVISGPNLAREIMDGSPAGALVASHYQEVVLATQALFAGSYLRLYGGKDVIGTEIGGAFKNIIALITGVATGMGFGDNTKSLIITRGLSEMARYGVALGADVFTFGGLAGIGDLMATCHSPLSRNFQVGLRLAQGEKLKDILAAATQVAEGVPTAKAVYEQAHALHLDLPLVDAIYSTLYEGMEPSQLLVRLMERPAGNELVQLAYR
jgi:glycerol-3-phosphate dehydrogenase (NAD(P)+)